MANYKVTSSDLTSVADAIRTKGGTSTSLSFPNGFVSAIQNIPTGGGPTLITKSITVNGTYDAQDDNADGYSEVTVNVSNTSGESIVTGTFTVPDVDPYVIQFGKTFTSYLIMIEMSDDSKSTLLNSGATNYCGIRYLGMYPAAVIDNNTLYGMVTFVYNPSNGASSSANIGATSFDGSSVTIPTKPVTGSATVRLIKGYTYNYVVVSLDDI